MVAAQDCRLGWIRLGGVRSAANTCRRKVGAGASPQRPASPRRAPEMSSAARCACN